MVLKRRERYLKEERVLKWKNPRRGVDSMMSIECSEKADQTLNYACWFNLFILKRFLFLTLALYLFPYSHFDVIRILLCVGSKCGTHCWAASNSIRVYWVLLLRNELAHGLLDEDGCNYPFAIHAWWLALKITFNTWWNSVNPIPATQDGSEEQVVD